MLRPTVHIIDPEKHADFLKEDRKDPVTGEPLAANDRIVFCAGCHSAFQEDSWNYMGKKHCNQSSTLSHFPGLGKNRFKRLKEKADIPVRGVAFIIDFSIGLLAFVAVMITLSAFEIDMNDGIGIFTGLLLNLYWASHDLLGKGRSLGKRFMGIQVVSNKEISDLHLRILLLLRNSYHHLLMILLIAAFGLSDALSLHVEVPLLIAVGISYPVYLIINFFYFMGESTFFIDRVLGLSVVKVERKTPENKRLTLRSFDGNE